MEQWPTLAEIGEAQRMEDEGPAAGRAPLMLTREEERQGWVTGTGAGYVPPGQHKLRTRIMMIAHCGAAGQRGQDTTLRLLAKSFFWPTMAADIKAFLHRCILCVKLRSGEVAPVPWGRVLRGRRPGDSLHLDYLTLDGLASDDGHGLLVLKDGQSLFCRLIACFGFNAINAENAILDWAADFGLPSVIVSDGGPHFKNKLLEGLAQRMRTDHHITTPYTAWANGIIERLNRAIVELLKVLLAERKKEAAAAKAACSKQAAAVRAAAAVLRESQAESEAAGAAEQQGQSTPPRRARAAEEAPASTATRPAQAVAGRRANPRRSRRVQARGSQE